MNFFQKHSLVHYIFHISIAIFLLFFLVFSENIFPHSFSYANNLVFGEKSLRISGEGEAYQKVSFEKRKINKKGSFFEKESFVSTDSSTVDLSFSDFTVVRSDVNTNFSVISSHSPEVSLQTGKIWVSTKEYVVTHLPFAQVETLAGSAVVKRSENGKIAVIAWGKPSRVTFLSKENTPLWSFLLPSHHQVVFSPDDYFSAEEFASLRFSKLKKEFPITKVETSDFISGQIAKDLKWRFLVLKSIEERKKSFLGTEITASLFSFSPNKKNEEDQKEERDAIRGIWGDLDQKHFYSFIQKLKNLSPKRRQNFYKYAGFFPQNEQASDLFVKSFPVQSGKLWKDLWTLESLIASRADNNGAQDKLREDIIAEARENNYDPEEIQFFAVSLFRNYSEFLSYAIIDFFYDANSYLIESETSPQEKLTRKLEIINDVFSFTQDLIDRKKYLLARKLLDKVETYLDNENSPLLAEKKKKILAQKEHIRGEVEYAEILGDKDKANLSSYFSIKENAEKQIEESNLHSSPSEEEYSVEKVKILFDNYDISSDSVEQDAHQKQLFHFEKETNAHGIIFSGTFNLQFEKFSNIIIYNKTEKRNDIYSYVFSVYEINEITKEVLKSLFVEKTPQKVEVVNTKVIPSEIADLVHTLTEDAFIKNDIMVHAYELKVIEVNTAKVVGAIAHYGALERQKEEEKRKKNLKREEDYILNKKSDHIEEYTFDCMYNVETGQVFDIQATAYDKKILLAGSMTIKKMIEVLDIKAKKIRKKAELKEETVLHLKSIGVSADVSDIEWKDENTLQITHMKERSTGVELSGIYKPLSQKFSQITLMNIAENPVILKKSISLLDLEADFQTKKEVLQEKVKKHSTEHSK